MSPDERLFHPVRPHLAGVGARPGASPAIDRIGPTRRPRRWPVMRQNWRQLLFLHWAVPAEHVRPLVPPQLDLDLFEDTAWVSLVAFTITGLRPVGLPPLPGLSSFHETNVRTYVHRGGRDPGVWFFSLDAANRLAVLGARLAFHLPYYHARMLLERLPTSRPGDPQSILYAGVRRRPTPQPAWYTIRATASGPVRPAEPGTLEHFLVERYLLHAVAGRRLYRGQVHHHPYPLQSAEVHSFEENLLTAAGIARPDSAPIAHFAGGVDVLVYGLQSGIGPAANLTSPA